MTSKLFPFVQNYFFQIGHYFNPTLLYRFCQPKTIFYLLPICRAQRESTKVFSRIFASCRIWVIVSLEPADSAIGNHKTLDLLSLFKTIKMLKLKEIFYCRWSQNPKDIWFLWLKSSLKTTSTLRHHLLMKLKTLSNNTWLIFSCMRIN